MFVSYETDEIRNCCLLLRPASMNSSFSSSEIKSIRAIIADLKSAPKLVDAPIKYVHKDGQIEVYRESFKITCDIISSHENPTDKQIERLKVVNILNTGLQMDMKKQQK